jgi:hypothetical protein
MIDYEFALYREAPYSVRNYESKIYSMDWDILVNPLSKS